MSQADALGHLRKVYPERPAGETESSVRSAYNRQRQQGAGEGKEKKKSKTQAIKASLKEVFEGRFNELGQCLETRKRGSDEEWKRVTDRINNSFWCYLDTLGVKCSPKEVQYVMDSDFTPLYNPVEERFQKAYDQYGGTGYIKEFLNRVEAADQEYWLEMGAIWLLAMANCWLHPGTPNHQILCFISDEQGIGKSTFARQILPPDWRMFYFNETMSDYANKDSKIATCTNLLINLDEIKKATSTKEQDNLKALVTMAVCNERLPYRNNAQTLLKRASFFATTNDSNIIQAIENSRRHLIIPVKTIDYADTINHDRLYADLYDQLLHGQKAYLDRPAIRKVMERNEAHRERCAEEEIFLANVIKPDEQHTGMWLTATEILNELNMRTTLNLNTYGVVKLGLLLKKLGYTQNKYRNGWKWYVYLIPVEQVNGEKYQPAQ
jgi:predicted P-loop ATPase